MAGTRKTGQTLLVVDDEPNIRKVLEAIFTREGYRVLLAECGTTALRLAAENQIHVLITDLIMPDMNGVEVLQNVKKNYPSCAAIIITAYGTIRSAVEATHAGAFDYLQKPFDVEDVKAIVRKATNFQSAGEGRRKTHLADNASIGLQCSSPGMTNLYRMVDRAAQTRATVLIRGESGTGKELIARAIHIKSNRCNKPFIAISCAALPENLLESELFGHEKNAFTGALNSREGRFETANTGSLFLDEIGEIPLSMQIKLLRVMQEWTFERVGSNKPITVDVRLIAATNSNLEQAVVDKKFREDLYHRMNVVTLFVPPLRERKEDILPLAEYFLKRYAERDQRTIEHIHPEASALLEKYSWPGNVRELENCMERAAVLSEEGVKLLTADLLPNSVLKGSE